MSDRYGLDLQSDGDTWQGTWGVLIDAAVADLTLEGEYGPVEVTLSDGEVFWGKLSPSFGEGAFNIGHRVVEVSDVRRLRA